MLALPLSRPVRDDARKTTRRAAALGSPAPIGPSSYRRRRIAKET
jgi:hypothetical protein